MRSECSVGAWMMSMTALACEISSLPLRKARSVNSPRSACRAPACQVSRRIRSRAAHHDGHALIDDRTSRIDGMAVDDLTRRQLRKLPAIRGTKYPVCHRQCLLAADANDTDAARPRSGGDGADGFALLHHRRLLSVLSIL